MATLVEYPLLVLVSDGGGYRVHRLIATMDRVPIYAPVGPAHPDVAAALAYGERLAADERWDET